MGDVFELHRISNSVDPSKFRSRQIDQLDTKYFLTHTVASLPFSNDSHSPFSRPRANEAVLRRNIKRNLRRLYRVTIAVPSCISANDDFLVGFCNRRKLLGLCKRRFQQKRADANERGGSDDRGGNGFDGLIHLPSRFY